VADRARPHAGSGGTRGLDQESGQEERRGRPVNDADTRADAPAPRGPTRKQRRLSDRVLIVFHFACDGRDFEVADRLLGILERIVVRPTAAGHSVRRTEIEPLVAAHERLWILRHPAARDY